MRKIISILTMVCIMAFSAVAFANYPTHLGGDRNFILCDGYMGTGWYVDRSSLSVQEYAPPEYIIAINVVTVHDADRGNTVINGVKTNRFLYDYDSKRMYVDNDGSWRYLNPNGSWAETGISMPAGELAFALAYNMKFYNYDDSFYNGI